MQIITRLIDMDVMIGEQIVQNHDDTYTILLNSRLSHERQVECYYHALSHIHGKDFEKDNADLIELDAHKKGANYDT